MLTNRRNWLKAAGIITAGVCLPGLKSFASPDPGFTEGEKEKETIRLSSNENPYGPSSLAKAAMMQFIAGSNRYPWLQISMLMSAIAAKNGLTAENVMIGPGSTAIIDAVIALAAKQTGSFMLATPTFGRWSSAAEKAGLNKIEVPLNAQKEHDLDAMLQAIRPDTRMVYLCNPNNPTGTICNDADIRAFLNEATSKTLVMVDEAYLEYSGQPSVADLVAENKNLLVVKTFSKIYGLAGARVGYGLGHADTIEKLGALQSGANMGISAVVSLAAALASLKDTGFTDKSYTWNEQARRYTISAMEKLNIRCIPSQTNFIYFSLANYKKDFFGLLQANHIQGTEIFEQAGQWSRITVGTMAEMERFIEAIS